MTQLPLEEFGGTFWLSVAGVLSAIIGLCLKSIYKSKCSEFNCCGITIKRDVQVELREDIELGQRNRGSLDEPSTPQALPANRNG